MNPLHTLQAGRQADAPRQDWATTCRQDWAAAYRLVRDHSLQLSAGLSAEDQALQSMPDASPTKWHLAHTIWFFKTLLLLPHAAGYRAVDARWVALFNSYHEVLAYRQQVDAAMPAFIHAADSATWAGAVGTLQLGLHHEQQHQEPLLTDIRHALSLNPLLPAYAPGALGWRARAARPRRCRRHRLCL